MATAASGSSEPSKPSKQPLCLIMLGMAGSGKTSFVQRLTTNLMAEHKHPYVINLDPACYDLPYPCNIDIRDTVNYKEVMKQFNLGPNGGIITSLNLFSTRFDQIMHLLEKRQSEYEYIILDTPGQIEVFTWSASGTIITDTLASVYPTVVVYVMDIVRSTSPITFMSNMLYACSILYKTKLPFIVVLNKIDLQDHHFAMDWMKDFEKFDDALEQEKSYVSNLTRSMSLVLDSFYSDLKAVGVSAIENEGIDEFFSNLEALRNEYYEIYRPEYERIKQETMNAKQADEDETGDDETSEETKKNQFDLKKEKLIEFGDHLPRNFDMDQGEDSDEEKEVAEMENEEEEDEEEKKEYKDFVENFVSKLKCDSTKDPSK